MEAARTMTGDDEAARFGDCEAVHNERAKGEKDHPVSPVRRPGAA